MKTVQLRDYSQCKLSFLIHQLTVHTKSWESSGKYDQAHSSSFCVVQVPSFIFIPSGIIKYNCKIWALRELSKVNDNTQGKKVLLSEYKLRIQGLGW